MKYLAIIPARGGSKGIPKKNIKLLDGKPLIQYTIEAARGVFEDRDICVSTDSKEIKSIVEEKIGLTVPFIRPAEFASDNAGMYDVLLHAITYYENNDKNYDTLVVLQPTSPLRKKEHIEEALRLYSSNIDMVVSVKETNSNPYYVLYEENRAGFLEKSKDGSYVRRQDCPKVWEYNGAVFVINVESIRKGPINKFSLIRKYVMDANSSVDIDNDLDWKLVEILMEELKQD